MNANGSGLINLAIVWGVASAVGFFVMAALMLVADWTLLQGLFAAAVIFFILGGVLSFGFLRPLPGPQEPGSVGDVSLDPVPSPNAAPAPTVAREAAPAVAETSAPAASAPKPAKAATKPAAEAAPDPSPEPAAAPEPSPPPEPAAAPAATATADPDSGGTRPEALDGPRGGTADDLKKIKGVGPKLEQLCNSLGFYHFDQIAAWTDSEVAWVDQNLEGFKGRVSRDKWVEQATHLAAGGDTEFSRKVDKGDVY